MDAENIIIERGVLYKRKTVIPFEKINTVDIRKNLIQRLFGVSRLRIDTGSALAQSMANPETSLIFSSQTAEKIREYILEKCEKEEKELTEIGASNVEIVADERVRRSKFSELAFFGLNQPFVVSVSSVVSIFIFVLSVVFDQGMIFEEGKKIVDVLFVASGMATGIIIMVAVVLVVFALLIAVVSFVFSLNFVLNYFNFTVNRKDDNLTIKYGLFTVKSYTLPVRNLHAVIMKQNLLCRLLGYCTLEVVSIGYGDGENEVALLCPLIKRKKVNEFLGSFLPELAVEAEMKKAPVRSLLFFGMGRFIFLAILFAVGCILFPQFIVPISVICGLLVLWSLIGAILARSNARLGFNDSVVVVSSGAFYRTITTIRQDCVQAVGTHGSVIKRAFNICNYRIDYHGPALKNSVRVKNLSPEFFNELGDVVEE